MVAKMVLPLLGGTPGVWNTCMVFFQAALLAGYGYTHATAAWLGVRRQAAIHVGLLLLPLLTLPIAVPIGWSPPLKENPVPWLLTLLLMSVGLPFFMISASAPLLQKWFASTGHLAAKDPYFLYGASNLGSVGALLSYPLLVEPNLRLADQSWVWSVGYGLMVVLILGCAVMLWRSPMVDAENLSPGAFHDLQRTSSIANDVSNLTFSRRMRWAILAFAPSSLMLGLTTYITTDIAAVPLLWVIPLAIYLLTFILVFARKPILPHRLMMRVFPILISPMVILMMSNTPGPMWLLLPLHLLVFFVASMICHGELVKDRPSTQHLTEFYLWMAMGGVLGGLFNALLAPVIFNTVAEYPLAIVLACLLRPSTKPYPQKPFNRWFDIGLPLLLGMLVVGLGLGLKASGIESVWLWLSLMLGLPVVICFSFRDRPIRFGLGIGAIILANMFFSSMQERVLFTERSFFGVYRVKVDHDEKYRSLVHGTTLHGMQSLDPTRSKEPLTYYYSTGPIGQVFVTFNGELAKPHVAIIGLGAGSLACYGQPGQHWTFYEIDPAIEQIAQRYFTFLRDCAPKISVVLGDARLSLAKAPDRYYGLIVLDAFSSDSIPVHLLTREALGLYLAKLADSGVLAFHISNRSLNLEPLLGNLAQSVGLAGLSQDDLNVSETEAKSGKAASQWVVMGRQKEDLAKLAQDPRWKLLPGRLGENVWTDDFSNIISVVKWQR
jgi:spermidine synthase